MSEATAGSTEAADTTSLETATPAAVDAASGGSSWVDALPPDLKAVAAAKGWDKFDAAPVDVMLTAYHNAERALGRGRVAVPDDAAPAEQWDQFFKAIGRPDAPDGYRIALPEKLPDGFAVDNDRLEAARKEFHKLGLTPKQAQALIDFSTAHDVQRFETFKAERAKLRQAAEQSLRSAWGADYDRNRAVAERVLLQFADRSFGEWLDEYGLKDDPAFMRFLHAVGKEFGEDTLVAGAGGGLAADPQRLIDQLSTDSKFLADIRGLNGMEARRFAQARWDELMERVARASMPAGV